MVFFFCAPAMGAESEFDLRDGVYRMPKDHFAGKLGRDLWVLCRHAADDLPRDMRRSFEHIRASRLLKRIGDGPIPVDVLMEGGSSDAMHRQLSALGMEGLIQHGNVLSGNIHPIDLDALAMLPGLRFVRPAYFTNHVGLAESQGDEAMRADIARNTFGVDGSGVRIGSLSDSYDSLGEAGLDQSNGDLPADVQVLLDISGGSDEGRAMMQLIADVAPGSPQAFHTAFGGQAVFADGIRDLFSNGSKVIVDDVIYFAEPMFQDGIVAQAVDEVVEQGAVYFSSAGNNARKSYESAFNPSGTNISIGGVPAGEAHDFDTGPGVDFLQEVRIPQGSTATFSFQWNSTYFSVSGGSGADNDLDFYLVDETQSLIAASSADNNIGGDPIEVLQFTNINSAGGVFFVLITSFSGANPGLLKYILFDSDGSIQEFDTASPTCYGHANAKNAVAVAAAFFNNTPVFGTSPAVLESFSSAGGVPVFFDTSGTPLNPPDLRPKPEITAPDGTNTTFFGTDIGADADSDPNFFGTSAAAPHAAAVAALMLEANPSLSAENILSILQASAEDMDDPSTPGFDVGFDSASGAGFIFADLAVSRSLSTDPERVPALEGLAMVGLGLGLLALAAARIRRP
jgi:hypothetical protein